MNKLRIYADTSVFGGYSDDEFRVSTRKFFDLLAENKFELLVSETVARELEDAPEHIQELFEDQLVKGCEQVDVTKETTQLASAYVDTGIVTSKYEDDALHVAHATIARADVIVSWNFHHLVNPVRIRAFNEINLFRGYGPIVILTPADLIGVLEESDETE